MTMERPFVQIEGPRCLQGSGFGAEHFRTRVLSACPFPETRSSPRASLRMMTIMDANSTPDREAPRLGVSLLRAALVTAALLAGLFATFAARADGLDDTLALFLEDKFPQTEKAIAALAAEAPP